MRFLSLPTLAIGLALATPCLADPGSLLSPDNPSYSSGWHAPASPTAGLKAFSLAQPKDWLQMNKNVTPSGSSMGGMSGMPGIKGGNMKGMKGMDTKLAPASAPSKAGGSMDAMPGMPGMNGGDMKGMKGMDTKPSPASRSSKAGGSMDAMPGMSGMPGMEKSK